MVQSLEGTGLPWLYERIEKLGYPSLSAFAKASGINKGNLHRYFSHESKPAVTVLPTLCRLLEAEPAEVLGALGVELLQD